MKRRFHNCLDIDIVVEEEIKTWMHNQLVNHTDMDRFCLPGMMSSFTISYLYCHAVIQGCI